jgi:hypothetical protein
MLNTFARIGQISNNDSLRMLIGPKRRFFLSLIFFCACTSGNSSPLPADVPINDDAGRGSLLVVTLRLESGEELPFMVDSGTTGTYFDKSMESKLGKSLGTETTQSWGTKTEVNVYAMPKLYLGGALLTTDDRTAAYDLHQLSSQNGRPIKGILGYDCLRHYCVQLDFAAGKMRFLDGEHADKQKWGRAFPIVELNDNDARPAVAENLSGAQGPHSLIDSGWDNDGWLMPEYFQLWTNHAVPPARGEARSPDGLFGGEKYPLISLRMKRVESDGIGLRFLARHLVTLDFPKQTMYLQRQSIGPLPDANLKTTPMQALDAMVADVMQNNLDAARKDLASLEQGSATELEKTVAQKLVASLENKPKPAPVDAPPEVVKMPLGDARPESAEVGWLEPAANRIPLNAEIPSPLLDSGKIYATGLFAHAPSRYVFDLGGKWKTLRGNAGLHTAFQPYAFGVVFIIKTDGKPAFRTSVIRGPKHEHYEVNLTGVKTLELQVEKANDQNGGNWALWLDPTLYR